MNWHALKPIKASPALLKAFRHIPMSPPEPRIGDLSDGNNPFDPRNVAKHYNP